VDTEAVAAGESDLAVIGEIAGMLEFF